MARRSLSLLLVLFLSPLVLEAQRSTGPVIKSGGAVFQVPTQTFKIPDNHVFKAVYVIHTGVPDGSKTHNGQFDTVARFLNMHAQAGIPSSRVQVAAVVHGTAGKDLLNDAEYEKRFGTPNPSSVLIKELLGAGVQIILCGQTSQGRDIPADKVIPGVQIALSAMTALNVLQSEGYKINPW